MEKILKIVLLILWFLFTAAIIAGCYLFDGALTLLSATISLTLLMLAANVNWK